MIEPGEVISYLEMCSEEGVSLQRGMNYRLKGSLSVILMSQRRNAPYMDRIEEDGKVLVYEGHDIPKSDNLQDPKTVNQPLRNPGGSLTQNGLFSEAAEAFKQGKAPPEIVKAYEKIRPGIWVFNGFFRLTDAWQEQSGPRKVFKFKLELIDNPDSVSDTGPQELPHTRLIPSSVKYEVWKRDGGRCVECGSKDNLHFDHIIPYSKGGSSLVADNIQILCARHNLAKRDKIE